MSRINNCVFLCCDRCGHSDYYPSNIHAENSNWSLGIKIDNDAPLDLCPKCTKKWDALVRNFLANVDTGDRVDAGGLY